MTLDEARARLSEAEIARAKAWGQFREYDDKAREAYINLLHVEHGLRHAEQRMLKSGSVKGILRGARPN